MEIINGTIDLLNQHLKGRFFGIDRVIDEICDKIKAWYYVPESMIRPQIINLWGMTGVGKTSIIRDIAEFLKKDLIQIDLGEYVGDSTKNLGHNFFEKYYSCSKKPVIILIDEFHIARTVDRSGNEIDRKGIRSLWHLLSDGLMYVDESHMSESIDWARYLIEDSIEDYQRSVKYISTYKKPRLSKSKSNIPSNIPTTVPEKEIDNYECVQKRLSQPHKFFPRHYMGMISRALNYDSAQDLIKELDRDFVGTGNTLLDKLENISVQPKLDFTKALIFISGNLDDLYIGSDNFDPDIDLEILEKKAEEITVSDIKKDLTGRFRLEQIGRLGNNHVIYPVLNKDSYCKIINKDLNRLKQFYFEKHELNLIFDNSVIEIIYNEGVFPNQGARSVLSTVGTLVESALTNFFLTYKKVSRESKDVKIFFDSKKFIFKFGRISTGSTNFATEGVVEVPALLKIDELRKPVINQRSVISAVHEAGHIVTSVLCLGIVPNRASVFTTVSENNGIVEVLLTESKKTCDTFASKKNYISVTLAGLVAEKFIYDSDNVSCGATSDLRNATNAAIGLIANFGYLDLVTKSRIETDFNWAVFRDNCDENSVKRIIEGCRIVAQRIITENIPFLKSLADCLLSKTTVYKNDIIKIMEASNVKCAENMDYIGKYNSIIKDKVPIPKEPPKKKWKRFFEDIEV